MQGILYDDPSNHVNAATWQMMAIKTAANFSYYRLVTSLWRPHHHQLQCCSAARAAKSEHYLSGQNGTLRAERSDTHATCTTRTSTHTAFNASSFCRLRLRSLHSVWLLGRLNIKLNSRKIIAQIISVSDIHMLLIILVHKVVTRHMCRLYFYLSCLHFIHLVLLEDCSLFQMIRVPFNFNHSYHWFWDSQSNFEPIKYLCNFSNGKCVLQRLCFINQIRPEAPSASLKLCAVSATTITIKLPPLKTPSAVWKYSIGPFPRM